VLDVNLLAALRYALGRCSNIYCAGFTYQKCGRALWCLVVSLVWSVETVVRDSGQWMLSVMFVLSCRCLWPVVAVGWDSPFVIQE
jgi:hypothetical protein